MKPLVGGIFSVLATLVITGWGVSVYDGNGAVSFWGNTLPLPIFLLLMAGWLLGGLGSIGAGCVELSSRSRTAAALRAGKSPWAVLRDTLDTGDDVQRLI